MPRTTDRSKQQRKEGVWLAVKRSPKGITEVEIADFLAMERRTVNNYLRDLEDEGKLYKDGMLWYPLDYENTRLRSFQLEPEEAFALYLGVRLLVKQQDKRNQPAELALAKLADVLTADAGVSSEIQQAAHQLAQRPNLPGYQSVFRTVVRAYIYRLRIAIRYRPLNGAAFETTFDTYLIEPSQVGYSTYLIGFSEAANALRSYKLERIESAALTRSHYTIPAEFPGLDVLKNAWSIYYGNAQVHVRLRFSPQVSQRVQESVWHSSQKMQEDSERPGFLLWQCDVPDTTDMLPWIRGWGGDVEVLEPPELRATLQKEAARMTALYSTLAPRSDIPPFIAKWDDKRTQTTHPLLYHLIDAASVATLLWRHGLTPSAQADFCRWLKLPPDEVECLLAYWVALHDVGKATPTFQKKNAAQRELLAAQGFAFPSLESSKEGHHSLLSYWILEKEASILAIAHIPSRKHLLTVIGGHHGVFPAKSLRLETSYRSENLGNGLWVEKRAELLACLQKLYTPPALADFKLSGAQDNAFFNLLAGFMVTADWIASQEEFFRYEVARYSPQEYQTLSMQRAQAALERTGWLNPPVSPAVMPDFESLFHFPPNSIQQAVIAHTSALKSPFLMILEAPTGSGKTEAALYTAGWAMKEQNLRGMYIAMPTQATSNQMFERTVNYLNGQFPAADGHSQAVQLVHGNALLNDAFQKMLLSGITDEGDAGEINALTWFLPRKRSLLAPFGVGTVDQTFFSVLQTKHFFLRTFGLYRKVVIFDEVHAYDTYMSELFKRLLGWLRAIGCSVILLSATLPTETRKDLLAAFSMEAEEVSTQAEFPRLSLNDGKTIRCVGLGEVPSRKVTLQSVARDPMAVVGVLRAQLAGSGCAAVICNTVARAQEVYEAIHAAGLVTEDDLFLLHARMPYTWRKAREDAILERFGKRQSAQSAPRHAIVVATQVIEQSLDLDFDLLITDLAPVDLLIQRMGRLQRHTGSAYPPMRPELLAAPVCYVCMPTQQPEALADMAKADCWVYDAYILQRTFFTLQGCQKLRLPADSDRLIEAVYSSTPLPQLSDRQNELLVALNADMTKNQAEQMLKARNRMVGDVDDTSALDQEMLCLEEDNPMIHEDMQALTRDGRPGLSFVCLVKEGDQLFYLDQHGACSLEHAPRAADVQSALRSMVSLSNYYVLQHFYGQPKLPAWKRTPALRHAFPLIFEKGVCTLKEGLVIQLDEKMGLKIEKE